MAAWLPRTVAAHFSLLELLTNTWLSFRSGQEILFGNAPEPPTDPVRTVGFGLLSSVRREKLPSEARARLSGGGCEPSGVRLGKLPHTLA